MEWTRELIEKYIINNNIKTTAENIDKALIYSREQGYNGSLSLFLDALLADSKLMDILKRG